MEISIFKYKISEDEDFISYEVNGFIKGLIKEGCEIIDIDVLLQKKYLLVVIKYKEK